MANYDELFELLQSHHPNSRIQIAHDKQADLETLNSYELDRIGSLLLAASSSDEREEYPVIGEARVTKKQAFAFGAFA